MALSPKASARTYWLSGQAETSIRRQADELQPLQQIKEEARRSLDGAPPSDIDQVLNDHRFVTRGNPEDCCGQPRVVVEDLHHALTFHAADDNIGHSRERMIGRAQENATQSQKMVKQRKVGDRAFPVSEQFATAGSSHLQELGLVAPLALVHQLLSSGNPDRCGLQRGKTVDLK